MACRMLAEMLRRRSRNSKFETRVFVISRSKVSRSLSRCSSGLTLGDSSGSNEWSISEGLIHKPPEVQCQLLHVPIALAARHRFIALPRSPLIVTDKILIDLVP